MKQAFIEWSPKAESRERVQQCQAIVREYQAQGLVLTLRQLYYQFVSRDLIPNTERSYKNLGKLVSQARLAGMLDWDAIEDRGRRPDVPNQFSDLKHLTEVALRAYRLPRWRGQHHYAELWVEKAALAGVLEPIASEYHATLMVNKGYSSQSAMYESAKRIVASYRACNCGGNAIVFYLGDHDPSGEDMVRDVEERLNMFSRGQLKIRVKKLALTMAQIEEHNPPPNPAKMSDSRALAYVEKHGDDSWEVDALDPATLQGIIRKAFDDVIDADEMNKIKEREEEDKEQLREAVEQLVS